MSAVLLDHLALHFANLNPADVHRLRQEVGGPDEILSLDRRTLVEEIGLSAACASRIERGSLLRKAEEELAFAERFGIRVLVRGEEGYPFLLGECVDAPQVLFVKGTLDFSGDAKKWLAFVGTRHSTSYGAAATESLVGEIGAVYPETVVVSGLACGIDSAAHRAALANGLPTAAVLAHGLKTIYPPANRGLAASILEKGGALVTEFVSGTPVYRHQFLQRNRIIAGLCSGTVVVESRLRGGSMATANAADGYGREVLAVPGRIGDANSEGTNFLIRSSRAALVSALSDIEYALDWRRPEAPSLFPGFAEPLAGDEKKIYRLLEDGERSADELIETSGMTAASFDCAVAGLERKGLVRAVRGGILMRL